MTMFRLFLPLLVLSLVPPAGSGLSAQEGAAAGSEVQAPVRAAGEETRATLDRESFDRWERLENPTLSPDGRWLSYRVRREGADDRLHIRLLESDSLITVPRGSGVEFSADGRWLAYSFAPSEEERARLQSEGESIRRRLALVDLVSGEKEEVPGVLSFAFSTESGFLALRLYGSRSSSRGGDLVVRNLGDGEEMSFGNVADFEWSPTEEGLLGFIVDASERIANGVRLYDARDGRLRSLASGGRVFRELVWRDDRPDLAALEILNDEADAEGHAVWAWVNVQGDSLRQHRLDPEDATRFPNGMRISEHRPLRWSKSGSSLFLGLRDDEAAEPETGPGTDRASEEESGDADTGGADDVGADDAGPDEVAADEAGVDVEVWHARDVQTVPQQKIQARWTDRTTALGVWHLDEDRFLPLQEEGSLYTNLTAHDRLVVHLDEEPYGRERMFGPIYRDVYTVDPETGEREQVRERVQFFFGASPGGRYLLYLHGDDFWAYDRESGEHRNLTEAVPASFVNLEDDHTVAQKPPFGHAGWTVNDERVLLYDRHDIWSVAPDGSGGERLTHGAEERIRYRYTYLDRDERWIDLEAPVYLAMHGERSKRSGFARLDPDGDVEILVYDDRRITRLEKAAEADVYAFQAEAFDIPPNIHVGGPDLRDARQVTWTNSFQEEYLWGRSELLEYENSWGEPLQAALFFPADYEPGREYPMIVFPYERRSGTLHRYEIPTERDPYNTTVWTQRGYFVLAPDIVYRPRNPGISALEALEPAVDAVLETGMVNPERVGLIGHSWGGYQTTFILTQTDRFATGIAGAPLTNLISMYLSFFWNTGDPDARVFEISQARMEVPWWEDYASYVANSPVHHIQNLNTPLLMAFGTEDGAVDFHQGVEFYNAARRTGKDFVLLVYEGEGHSLRRTPNRVDLHRRILEWMDHYLKGDPAPAWITEGLPYSEQQRSSGQGGR